MLRERYRVAIVATPLMACIFAANMTLAVPDAAFDKVVRNDVFAGLEKSNTCAQIHTASGGGCKAFKIVCTKTDEVTSADHLNGILERRLLEISYAVRDGNSWHDADGGVSLIKTKSGWHVDRLTEQLLAADQGLCS